MKNAVGREIPSSLPGYKPVVPYAGPFATPPAPGARKAGALLKAYRPGAPDKVLPSIEAAIEASGLKDGMTVSFHSGLRNGDYVMNMVMLAVAGQGIKNLTLAPSALQHVHDNLVPLFERGVISAVQCAGMRGALARHLTINRPARATILRPHGGRARALECGELHVDVAFLAAPACDEFGNINGVQGPAACGAMGYAMVDARYADTVVAVTDNLMPHPLCPVSIPQRQVDFVVPVDCIGDPGGIATGALRGSRNPRDLAIAGMAASVIGQAGYFKEGFAMQLGAGAISIAVGALLRDMMLRDKITASLGIGGIAGPFCDLLDEGLIRALFDTQSFDGRAIQSLRDNPGHQEYDCGSYANPWNKGAMVNNLDYVVLGATEIDVNFNVNVLTDSSGIIMGGLGGHPDASAGARCSIVTAPLLRGSLPMITDAVQTVCTPGETVDVVVTDRGVAVNPARKDLLDNLKRSGLPLKSMEELRDTAIELVGRKPEPLEFTDEITGVVEYRDGTVLDVIRKPLV